jgi:hypothetical protein
MNPTFGAANDSGVGVAESPEPVVARLSARAFPNPFLRSAAISYTLREAGRARVQVFDAAGREVATLVDGVQPAGLHTVRFTPLAKRTPTGVYFVKVVVRPDAGAEVKQSLKLVRTR